MSDLHTPYQPDPDQLRTERAYYQLIHTLHTYLPPPLDDTQEALRARNDAALAQVAAMAPVNADEAEIAAHCVATRAQAGDVLRQIRANAGDMAVVMKLQAQFIHMERTASSIRNLLQRLQGARRKRDGNDETADTDAWTRHIATRLMEQALERGPAQAVPEAERKAPAEADDPPPPASPVPASPVPAAPIPAAPVPAAPVPAAPEAARPARAPSAELSGRRRLRIVAEADDPPRDLAAEAEHYAAVYPNRAREIRRNGGLPPNCSYGPPDDELVQELLTSPSAALRALDDVPAAAD